MMDIEAVKEGMKMIEAGIRKMDHGPLTYYLTELTACYELLMEKYAPFKVGDRVILTDTPTITKDEAWGWLGSKHFLIKGAKGTVQEARCGSKGFGFGVVFDDETWIHPHTKELMQPKEKSLYYFGERWLVKQ